MSLVNLLPEDYVARQAQKRANVFCSILFGVVVVGVLAAAVVSERGYRRTWEVSERVNESYAQAGKLIRQLRELDATRRRLLGKAKLTAGLLERVPRSYLLAVVTKALPEGSSLTRFDLQSKRRVPVAGSAAKSRYGAAAARRQSGVNKSAGMDIVITVTGLSATDLEVGHFIAAMARCPLMDAVDLVYSQEKRIEGAVVREFQVVLRLKPEADVRGERKMSGGSLTFAGQEALAERGGKVQ